MFQDFIIGLGILASLLLGGEPQPQPTLGAFSDPFLSIQLAASPANGECLTTDGTNNDWTTCASGGGGGGGGFWATTTNDLIIYPTSDTYTVSIGDDATTTSEFWFDPNTSRSKIPYASTTMITATTASTTDLIVSGLNAASCDVKANEFGVLSCGTDATGGAGGSGSVSTSTNEVANQVAVFTSNSATPALIGGDTDFTFSGNKLTATYASSTGFSSSYASSTLLHGGTLRLTGKWLSNQGVLGLTLSDDGSNLSLTSDVGGTSNFVIATAGSFFEMVANPGPSNGYLLAHIAETQGDDTDVNFYEGGNGHNRFWNSGSTRLGGLAGYLCSNLTNQVDCIAGADGLGADLVLADDFWLGGKIIATSTTETSTFERFFATNGTTTNATTTSFAILNLTAASCDVKASTAGILSCGTDATAGAYDAWTHPNAGDSATTSRMIFNSASSTFTGGVTMLNATATNATSTTLNVSGQVDIDGLTSALVLAGSTGILSEYAGATCTNQVITALSAAGAATCTTLTSAYLDLTANYAWTGTHDFGGGVVEIPNGANPTVDAIGEIAIDTTANELLYATSTNATAPAVLKPYKTFAFSYASSTQGTGTTTRSLGPVDADGYFDSVQCDFNNFMRVMMYDGTNRMDDLVASSTVGTVKFTQNQSYTAGEALRVDVGTTTNIASNVFGGCRAKFFYTRN